MINWLINSTLCSGMMLGAYYLLLKNTSLFNFNRAYLFVSLLFSLLVPFIVIQQRHTVILPAPAFTTVQYYTGDSAPVNPAHYTDNASATYARANYALDAVVLVYALVTSMLLLRFFRNLYKIMTEAARYEKVRQNNAWFVLTHQDLVPYTFLKYIFLNKTAYKQNNIEKSLLDHEMAHATQYHSVDVIFTGLLQAILWFNPFLFFYRKAIQLNHEFIADAVALRGAETVAGYQQLLLAKSSLLYGLSIASQFNYSITKKRLIMMTKHTSATVAWFARLSVLPLMAAAFLLFCTKTQAQQLPATKTDAAVQPAKRTPTQVHFAAPGNKHPYPSTKEGISATEMEDYMAYEKKFATRRLSFDRNMTTDDEKHLEQLYQRMSPEQQKDRAISFTYPPDPLEGGRVTLRQLESFRDPVQYGIWVDDKRIDNAILNDLDPKKFCILMFSRLTPRAVKNDHFHYQITLMTKPYYKKYVENAVANRNNSMIMFHLKS